MVINISDLEFPSSPEKTYYSGPISIEFTLTTDTPLKTSIFDVDDVHHYISIIDDNENLRSVPVSRVKVDTDTASTYKFLAYTDSKYFVKGRLRVFGVAYSMFGEPVFIRKLYLLA